MSENPNSSESAVEEIDSAPPADVAQPEPISAPKKGDKKKMWVVVVAVIVVAALIGSAAYMWVIQGEKLEVTMSPDSIPNVAAGGVQALSVVVKFGGDVVTEDVTYSWSVDPSTLGEFDYSARADVQFEAGDAAGTGTVTCEVTYDGKTESVEAAVEVDPPFLDSVNILPSYATIYPGVDQVFDATAVNSLGDEVAGATISWSVSDVSVGDYTLSSTSGSSVTFSASVEAVVTLTATATIGSESAFGTAIANVTTDVSPRTVDYLWYDMFEHEIGPWYEDRYLNYGEEYALTDGYPYLYVWTGAPPGNDWVYTFLRMDMVGRNMTDLNMNENPEFLPFFGDARGGNAELDWYMTYLTREESEARLSLGAHAYYDGWYVVWNGTITLDEQAAKGVLGVTETDLENFDTWWAANGGDTTANWQGWLGYEAGNERLAIYGAYVYDLTFVIFEMDAEMVDGEVVITFETVSWGMEALMFRWMNEGWMSDQEWYMEDMYLNARIGPEKADIDLDAAMLYALYAYETAEPDNEGIPCWCWEGLLEDYVTSTVEYPISLYDAYAVFDYLNMAPGNIWYDTEMVYDYTPGAWNLSEGETLALEWPEEECIFFAHSPGSDGVIPDVGINPYPDTINFMENMTVEYAEPMWTDAADYVSIDYDANLLLYEGPFDMWTWSKDQTAHEWLADEWDRMGILPYGIPFIEFKPDVEGDDVLDILVTDVRSPLTIGEESSFNVTVVNQVMSVYTDYAGTISFESSDLAAILPDDYTFVPGTDAGVHEFTVTFNTVDAVSHDATHTLTAFDVDDATISGTQDEIEVVEYRVIDRFEVTFSGDDVIATEPTTATVTAYDQWDDVHDSYEGTVVFDSDDSGATLPAPTAFTDAMDGVQDVEVTYSAPGLHTLNVTDQDVTSASGEDSVTVLDAPEADRFDLTGVNDPSSTTVQPETMVITVYDQYDREFTGYDGTVSVESNDSVGVTLPGEQTFTLGDSDISVDLTFTVADMYYTIYVNDTSDPTITGTLSVWVVGILPELSYFTVTGIEDMWENNYSSVTVTAYDQYDTVFEAYVGEITFSTDASGTYDLPADYTFDPADDGVRDFPASVMFDDPGTYSVTVEDTSDSSLTGSQVDIEIENLVASSLLFTDGPSSVTENETFGVTVTCYHQHDEVFVEYDGTVTFETSDTSAYYALPADHEFDPAVDAGERAFVSLSLSELGAQTVTVEDTADSSLTDTLDIEVTAEVLSSIVYTVSDMFEEQWGPFCQARLDSPTWDTERLLTNDDGQVTYMYSMDHSPSGDIGDAGQIYAPYRWNIAAEMIPNVDVHAPEIMPTVGAEIPGAEATIDLYWQYIFRPDVGWWTTYWEPEWSDHTDWVGNWFPTDTDGYFMATIYNITMNREAAEEWMGMGQGDDPDTWWAANEDTYVELWSEWLDYEANDRLDIFCGYEWIYIDYGNMMRLTGDGDSVYLQIAHMSAGYETLMTRWLLETEISVHQTYMEDFSLVVDYREDDCDLDLDGVCQWNMHAVKANASAPGDNAPGAWVWEPIGMDYIHSTGPHTESQYDPYSTLTYQSWNCGDVQYSLTDRVYEYTPWAFSLPEYGSLVFELPQGEDVIGYYGEVVPEDSIGLLWAYEPRAWDTPAPSAAYDAIRYYGEMDLGYCMVGDAVWDYDDVDKILTIEGPYTFENPREGDLLYHGAPWIEFNVTPVAKAVSASDVPIVGLEESSAPAGSAPAVTSAASELVSLAAMISAVMLTITALAAGAGRRREYT